MISILICTFNRKEKLLKLLNDLEQQNSGSDHELIVINNNSSDETHLVLDEFSKQTQFAFKSFIEMKPGSSAARNRAIKEASGDVLVFLDDDLRLTDSWLSNLTELIAAKKSLAAEFAFGVRVVASWQKPVPEWLDREKLISSVFPEHDFGLEAKIYPFRYSSKLIRNPITANFICSKSLFEKYGLFNEELGIHGALRGACEDTEFCWRLISKGVLLSYEPSLAVIHPISEERMTKSFIRSWYKVLGRYLYRLKSLGLNHLSDSKEPIFLMNLKAFLKAIYFLCLSLLNIFSPKRSFAYSACYFQAIGELEAAWGLLYN